jgi:catechol 2,3-dioxygenase-like lactoylglutathione lyase family enzyme
MDRVSSLRRVRLAAGAMGARRGGVAVKIEHVAYQVKDPVAASQWYVDHLGLTIKRAEAGPPFGRFLADDGDAVMLELYNNPSVAQPDYWQIDPIALHVAFRADDLPAVRARLIAAGATAVGDVRRAESGDELAMLRDPWGLPVQLVKRKTEMIGR